MDWGRERSSLGQIPRATGLLQEPCSLSDPPCHTWAPGPPHLLACAHLLIIILRAQEIIHDSDPGAQLLTQHIQEAVSIPASHGAGESEELPAARRAGRVRAGGTVGADGPGVWLWGRRPAAVQAGIGVGLRAAGGGQAP